MLNGQKNMLKYGSFFCVESRRIQSSDIFFSTVDILNTTSLCTLHFNQYTNLSSSCNLEKPSL